jgi:hypothetical protein
MHAYTDPATYELLLNSFIFAAGASIVATILATVLGWIAIRTNAPFRKFFRADRDRSQYLSSGDARGLLDRAVEPAHRIDQPCS